MRRPKNHADSLTPRPFVSPLIARQTAKGEQQIRPERVDFPIEQIIELRADDLLPGMHVAQADIEKRVMNTAMAEFKLGPRPAGPVNLGIDAEIAHISDGIGPARPFAGSSGYGAHRDAGRRQHLAHRARGTRRAACGVLRQLRQDQKKTGPGKAHVAV